MIDILWYLRVSTNFQDVQRQKDEIENYCLKNGFNMVWFYEDKISWTTWYQDRIWFRELLLYIKTNKVNNIIVTEISRFSRNMDNWSTLMALLRREWINIYTSSRWLYDFDNIQNKLLSNIELAISEYELWTILKRNQTWKITTLLSNNTLFSKAPYWYDLIKVKKIDWRKKEWQKLIINNEESKIVKKMFEIVWNEKKSIHFIKSYLTFNKIKNKNWSLNWATSTIKKILKNEIYYWRFIWHIEGQKFEFEVDRIIDKELFTKTQLQLHENYAEKVNPNHLSNFLLKNRLYIKDNNWVIKKMSTSFNTKKQNKNENEIKKIWIDAWIINKDISNYSFIKNRNNLLLKVNFYRLFFTSKIDTIFQLKKNIELYEGDSYINNFLEIINSKWKKIVSKQYRSPFRNLKNNLDDSIFIEKNNTCVTIIDSYFLDSTIIYYLGFLIKNSNFFEEKNIESLKKETKIQEIKKYENEIKNLMQEKNKIEKKQNVIFNLKLECKIILEDNNENDPIKISKVKYNLDLYDKQLDQLIHQSLEIDKKNQKNLEYISLIKEKVSKIDDLKDIISWIKYISSLKWNEIKNENIILEKKEKILQYIDKIEVCENKELTKKFQKKVWMLNWKWNNLFWGNEFSSYKRKFYFSVYSRSSLSKKKILRKMSTYVLNIKIFFTNNMSVSINCLYNHLDFELFHVYHFFNDIEKNDKLNETEKKSLEEIFWEFNTNNFSWNV